MFKSTFNKMGFATGYRFYMYSNPQGEVFARGYNQYGQLGTGNTDNAFTDPVKVLIDDVIMFDCGYFFSCFLKANGDVYVCGMITPSYPYPSGTKTPTKVASDIVAIACSDFGINMLTNTGTVKVIGRAPYGQGYTYNSSSLTSVYNSPRLSEIMGIAIGNCNGFYLTSERNMYYVSGGTGSGTNTSNNSNAIIHPLTDIKAVSSGFQNTLFLKTNGEVYSSGDNRFGQLGIGSTANNNSACFCNISGVAQVASGVWHSLFLKTDGTVWACGQNKYGELGIGSTENKTTPVKCNIDEEVIGIYAGWYMSAFLTESGMYFAGLRPF